MGCGLVLGGGGAAAVAWHGGVLTGLAGGGVDLTGLDQVVATSAGAVVAVHLARGVSAVHPGGELRRARTLFPSDTTGHDPRVWAEMLAVGGDRAAVLRRIGRLPVPPEATVRAAGFAARLAALPGAEDWPAAPRLQIPVIDADTGETVVLGSDTGVDPVTALRATCAVPGMLPAVRVAGRRCYDGGVATPTHADLAAGCARVLVLAPFADSIFGPVLAEELARLSGRAQVAVIRADGAALAGFGPDPFDATGWQTAADAGLAQGSAEAGRVRALLSAPR